MPLETRNSKLEIFFITDQARIDAFEVCKKLPIGAHVILRDYENPQREEFAIKLQKLCRQKRLKFLIGKTPQLARKLRADGVHFPEFMAGEIKKWKMIFPQWIISTSLHKKDAFSKKPNADFILLSPIFKTGSNPSKKPIGALKSRLVILHDCNNNFIALGGINQKNAKRLKSSGFLGLAGISEVALCVDNATKFSQIG